MPIEEIRAKEGNLSIPLYVGGETQAQTDAATEMATTALPDALAREWDEWLPSEALWLPLGGDAGVLLARDLPWRDPELALLTEWAGIWHHAWQARQMSRRGWAFWRRDAQKPPRGWRPWRWAIALGVLALVPVRLTVLAPGELVPANPAVIRAPLEGVIDTFHVQPNEAVHQGQPRVLSKPVHLKDLIRAVDRLLAD